MLQCALQQKVFEFQLKLQSIIEFNKLRTFWWAVGCPIRAEPNSKTSFLGHPLPTRRSFWNSVMLYNFSWNSLAFSCSTHFSSCKNSQDNLTRRRGVQQCAACPPSLSRILMPPHPTAIFWRMQYQGIKIYFPHIWRTIQLCDLLVHLQICQKSNPATNTLLTLGLVLSLA